MSKARTEAELSEQLTADRTWRLREISDLVSSIERADDQLKQPLVRALIALAYAHWEGGVRFAARKLMEHLALKRLTYAELDRQHRRNHFIPRLASIAQSNMNMADRCKLIDDILDSETWRFGRANDDLIQTRANLNFEVFADICLVCGVSPEPFKEHETFVDVLLLKRRNSIAHGEDTLVSADEVPKIANTTVELIRRFSDELENLVVMKSYRAAG